MLPANHRLHLIRIKVERAYKHINDLEDAIRPFSNAITQTVSFDRDPDTGKPVVQSSPIHIYDSSIPAITGDVVHNLMAALDHLAYQLVCVGIESGIPRTGKPYDIYFPIAHNSQTYESRKSRYIEGARREAIEAIDRLKPYKEGNAALWLLYKLDIADKHSLILAVGSDFIMDGISFKANDPYFSDFGLFRFAHDEDNVNLSGSEPLVQPTVGRTNALLPTLVNLADYVSNIVDSFLPLLGPDSVAEERHLSPHEEFRLLFPEGDDIIK
jgi:hypothetical protein